jgi:hypothetical protein
VECQYNVYFRPSRVHPKKVIKELVARYPELKFDRVTDSVFTPHEKQARGLFEDAKRLGVLVSLDVRTSYDLADAVSGELGLFSAASADVGAKFPKDAFDFSTGCPRCGLGAAQVKPVVLPQRAKRCKAEFGNGAEWSGRLLVRPELGQAIIDATGQPWCMRHPVWRSGEVVEEWMEPVPCATMPPLSSKSRGVSFGRRTSGCDIGEPAEIVEPCCACGRSTWDFDLEQHARLVYSRAATDAAQRHAVVAMYEPHDAFPEFDPIERSCKVPIGLPWLLFSRTAVEVIVDYLRRKNLEEIASIQPVFSE